MSLSWRKSQAGRQAHCIEVFDGNFVKQVRSLCGFLPKPSGMISGRYWFAAHRLDKQCPRCAEKYKQRMPEPV